MIDHINALVRKLVSSLAVVFLLSGAAFAEQIEWISGGLNPPGSTAAVSVQHFADLVKERSNGRIIIKHYPASQLGTGQEQIEALTAGTQQMFISAGSQASRLVKAFSVIDTAFLFKDLGHVQRFIESDMGQGLQQEMVDKFGVRILAQNWYGLPRYLMHKSKFIMSVDDVEGVRTRSASVPMFIKNYENMGAVPVKIAYGEQYLALRQGVVDMTESSAHNIFGVKLHEVAPYITEADMMFPQNSVYLSEAAWAQLSPEDQEIIRSAATEAGEFYSQMILDRFEEEKAQIIEQGGKFQRMPEETRLAFSEIIREKVPEMEEAGLIPEGWYDRILELRDQ